MSNKGSIDITLPSLEMLQPDNGDGYLVVARDLLQGVKALSSCESIPPRACALIAAHALECILKAYLWHKEKRNDLKDAKHNILVLWNLAYGENTLGISDTPPDWVRILSEGHGPNYYFRYQMGQNRIIVNGGQTPELASMAEELSSLLKQVELEIKATE
jgi:hypothetical protein